MTPPEPESPAVPSPAAPAPPEDRQATEALVLGTMAFTACFYAWSLLGPLGPDLQDSLGLSDFELSVMVAVPVILGSLLRVPFGVMTDRLGGRRVFVGVLLFTLAPLVALALWHDSYAGLLVLGLLLGVSGASFAIGVPFVSRWYAAHRQGFALGVYGAGMGGTVLAGLTAPRIADAWGLAAPFWVAAGLVAVVAVIFAWRARTAGPPLAGGASLEAMLAPFRRDRRAWALTLFYFLAFGGFVAMFLYLPKLLTGVHHLSRADAGTRAAGFALLAVIARPTGGWLSDRVGARRVLMASFVGTGLLALGLAASYRHMVPLTACCLTMAVALGLGTGAVFRLVAEWFPRQVGSVTGVVGASGGLGGFFPPIVMGIVKSATGSYVIGFALLALVAVVCLAVLVRLDHAAPEVRGAPASGVARMTAEGSG
ncbi:MAG TPA: MFS transporter [Solirubrobacteraceae bacterium]|nr:MFS transporter [Solirubrobacteraceae bacterium]